MRAADLSIRAVESLYVDVMALADEAQHYFDFHGRVERDFLSERDRISFSTESVKVSTRLLNMTVWLLARRAAAARGEAADGLDEGEGRLPEAPDSFTENVERLPTKAGEVIVASVRLHERAERLQRGLLGDRPERGRTFASPLIAVATDRA